MSLTDALISVLKALDACAIPYMIVGGFSTNAYGIERSTKDLDLVIELGDSSILRMAEHLPPEIRIDPQMTFETVMMTRRYIANIEGTPFQVEFFLNGTDPHDRERFRRRRHATFQGDHAVYYPTPEDVIVTKLRWGRSKDLDDVRDVIAVQDIEDRLDWDYILSWSDRHGTRDRLDTIRRSIPPL